MTSQEIEYSLDTKDMNRYFIKKVDSLEKHLSLDLYRFHSVWRQGQVVLLSRGPPTLGGWIEKVLHWC